jgi:hypothetical protein
MGKRGNYDDATRLLLEEGVRSYLKANAALKAFEQEVCREWRHVLERHLDDYASALRLQQRPKKAQITDAVYRCGDWDAVGVKMARKGMLSGVKAWEFYCQLYWDEKEPECQCYVGDWYYPRNVAQDVHQRLQDLDDDVWGEGHEVGLWQCLEVKNAGKLGENMESLLCRWIKLWKKVGGMKAALQG